MTITQVNLTNPKLQDYGTNSSLVTFTANNLYNAGYSRDNIVLSSEFGTVQIPEKSTSAFIINFNNSGQSFVSVGYSQVIDNTENNPTFPYLVEGVWCKITKYWGVVWNVKSDTDNGLLAFKMNNKDFKATLPNGEFIGQMMQNRINEIENVIQQLNDNITNFIIPMITQINANYATLLSTFNSHIHPAGSIPAPSGATTATPASTLTQVDLSNPSNYTDPSTLSKDTNLISNQNYLLNNHGEMYS